MRDVLHVGEPAQEDLPQARAGAGQARAHGAQGQAQALGHLPVGELLELVQDEHLALLGTEFEQRLL